jgi:hypothetical protein
MPLASSWRTAFVMAALARSMNCGLFIYRPSLSAGMVAPCLFTAFTLQPYCTWENSMSKKPSPDDISDSNETTEATLASLAAQIDTFVREGTLDSRCAAKLVRRLKKEADAISKNDKATKAGRKALEKAFESVDGALRNHDAGLLVMANAALRETDEATGVAEKR